jgi:hypothetical protein
MTVDDAKLAKLRELANYRRTSGSAWRGVNRIHKRWPRAGRCQSARQSHDLRQTWMWKDSAMHYSRSKSRMDLRSIYLNCEDFKQHTFPNV